MPRKALCRRRPWGQVPLCGCWLLPTWGRQRWTGAPCWACCAGLLWLASARCFTLAPCCRGPPGCTCQHSCTCHGLLPMRSCVRHALPCTALRSHPRNCLAVPSCSSMEASEMLPSLHTTARLVAEVARGAQLLVHNGDISCEQMNKGGRVRLLPPPALRPGAPLRWMHGGLQCVPAALLPCIVCHASWLNGACPHVTWSRSATCPLSLPCLQTPGASPPSGMCFSTSWAPPCGACHT